MTIPVDDRMVKGKMKLDRKAKREALRMLAHVGALSMLATLLWRYFNNSLGADPVRELLLQTGEWSLFLLVLSLAITPVVTLTRWNLIMLWRRILGLYAIFYVSLHFLVFIGLDYGFNAQFIVQGVLEQNFALIGFTAFMLLIPLAITSNKWSMRRLGKKWKTLHRVVYIIIGLALIHFFWLVKNVYYVPTMYATAVSILLLLRWKPVKKWASAWQRQMSNRRKAKKAVTR